MRKFFISRLKALQIKSRQDVILNVLKNWPKCLEKSSGKSFSLCLWWMCNIIILIVNYLSNRYQRVKIRYTFSSYLELLRGVLQGSILDPILFNLFINDLMLFIQETKVCNFADDATIYIHVHQILKKQLTTRIWFLIGLELILWWQTLANSRLCFSGQILIIKKLHLWLKMRE